MKICSHVLKVLIFVAAFYAVVLAAWPIQGNASSVCLSKREARELWPRAHLYWFGKDHCWSNRRGPPRGIKVDPLPDKTRAEVTKSDNVTPWKEVPGEQPETKSTKEVMPAHSTKRRSSEEKPRSAAPAPAERPASEPPPSILYPSLYNTKIMVDSRWFDPKAGTGSYKIIDIDDVTSEPAHDVPTVKYKPKPGPIVHAPLRSDQPLEIVQDYCCWPKLKYDNDGKPTGLAE